MVTTRWFRSALSTIIWSASLPGEGPCRRVVGVRPIRMALFDLRQKLSSSGPVSSLTERTKLPSSGEAAFRAAGQEPHLAGGVMGTTSSPSPEKSRRSKRYKLSNSTSSPGGAGSAAAKRAAGRPGPESRTRRTWSCTSLGRSQPPALDGEDAPPDSDDESFTVMSYNVLADYLARRHRHDLYPKVPEGHLSWEARWPRIARQLSIFRPDIMCLQEVEASHYESCFRRHLEPLGYRGVFKQRTNGKEDGCAIFYRSSRFRLVDRLDVEFFVPGVGVLDRDNVAVMVKLAFIGHGRRGHRGDRRPIPPLVVANTHLLFNPRRHDIKLAQLAVLLADLDLFTRVRSSNGRTFRNSLACILTGDLNLEPHRAAFKDFLMGGRLFYENLCSKTLEEVGGDRRFSGSRLLGSHLLPPSMGITDSCQHASQVLGEVHPDQRAAFLNSLQGTGSCHHSFGFRSAYPSNKDQASTKLDFRPVAVDHILYSCVFSHSFGRFIEGNLKLLSRLDLPSRSEFAGLHKQGGLPSESDPSDHLPLMARFSYKFP